MGEQKFRDIATVKAVGTIQTLEHIRHGPRVKFRFNQSNMVVSAQEQGIDRTEVSYEVGEGVVDIHITREDGSTQLMHLEILGKNRMRMVYANSDNQGIPLVRDD